MATGCFDVGSPGHCKVERDAEILAPTLGQDALSTVVMTLPGTAVGGAGL